MCLLEGADKNGRLPSASEGSGGWKEMHVSLRSVWGRTSKVLATSLILALGAGCPGDDDDDDDDRGRDAGTGGSDAGTDAGADAGTTPGGSGSVTGKVTYDFVPATYSPTTRSGTLAFAQTTLRPVRNAVVQVLQGSTVLASTETDAQGNYHLSYLAPPGAGLSVVVLAKTASPVIQVEDNTDGNAVWALGSGITVGPTTLNLHATHGWTGSSYNAALRTAAPFAILDSMYTAAQAFLAVRPVNFPMLRVNWSPDNVPQSGDKATGRISTSHFDSEENEIYILGKDGADSDEFDSHVIVHEWGHYFEHNLSRADSPGGPHSRGDVLDPRLAFGEGYGNALSAILLPTKVYADTYWAGATLTAFGFDMETAPTPTDDPSPGAFSETSVMRLLYDLFDDGATEAAYDQVSIGLGTFYDVLVGPQRTTPAMTTIGSFIAGLKAQPGVNATAVNTLLAHYNIGPVTSPWGDGDTSLRSMYTQVTSYPYNLNTTLVGGVDSNKRSQNRYYILNGTGGGLRFSASSPYDVGIAAYLQGSLAGAADIGLSGTETFSLSSTQADATYILVLTGFRQTAGSYDVSLSISSQ